MQPCIFTLQLAQVSRHLTATKVLQVNVHESALLVVAFKNRSKRVQRVASRDGLLLPFQIVGWLCTKLLFQFCDLGLLRLNTGPIPRNRSLMRTT